MSAKNRYPEDDPDQEAMREWAPAPDDAAEPVEVTRAADPGAGDPAAASQDVTAELLERLEQAETLAAEYLDSLQRERASFQNYRKRVERERAEQAELQTSRLLLKLLPILDDFDRAMAAIPQGERGQWFDGVALIQRKLERFMADEGVTEIAALGEAFDPALHEAVAVVHDADAKSGTIVGVTQRGYLYGGRVLRPALVRVAG
ncbi:MAG TPA: nucleotide exchange factor GrpE [Aggregatilineaceae bacterium]|nr:nucleotide exchange factor GrpE [Aggregatilineaceae bacterium]